MPRKIAAVDIPTKIGEPPLFSPNFERLMSHTDWRRTWTHIVSGRFTPSSFSGLLFYEQSNGYAEFYETDGQGGISFLQNHSDWPKSWTHIVPGSFHGPDFTGLLFDDQEAGFAAIYDTDGSGNLIKLHEHSGWRTSWTHITTVRVPGSDFSGVVLYDQAAGHGEIHSSDGSGGLQLIMESDGWRTTWSQVVGDFIAGTGLLSTKARPLMARYILSTSTTAITSFSGYRLCGMDYRQPLISSLEILGGLTPASFFMTARRVGGHLCFTTHLLTRLLRDLSNPAPRPTTTGAPVWT